MARQFNGRITQEALRAQLVGEGVSTGSVLNAVSSPAAWPAALAAQLTDTIATQQPGTDAEQVTDWLTRLYLLKGVPFNYLVPDIAMLPTESIRFFQIDNNWIEALLDGAYSIGFAGASQSTSAQARSTFLSSAAMRARSGLSRQSLLAQVKSRTSFVPSSVAAIQAVGPLETPEVLSGFLLRSAVVAGWPGLEAHGFSDIAGTSPLQIVRMETVAPSLLLCIFAGVVARVDLQEPSEAVHFGVDGTSPAWQKDLRYANGNATMIVGSYIDNMNVQVTLRGTGTPAIIPIDTLA